jgi:hypothetical protein
VNPGAGAGATIAPADVVAGRVQEVDWARVSHDLDGQGSAMLERLLTPEECRATAELYPDDALFRSRVVMARHGFGRGEYKYFEYPLPEIIARLRTALYLCLAPIANRWNEAMGDYNCLHQDVYGDLVFPLQVAVLLSDPGRDFTGGEFVMTEQRPRMQSRAEVVPLRQGDAVVFTVRQRPVKGGRGFYRVNLRHGVSRIRSGRRHTLGIIFHDAA